MLTEICCDNENRTWNKGEQMQLGCRRWRAAESALWQKTKLKGFLSLFWHNGCWGPFSPLFPHLSKMFILGTMNWKCKLGTPATNSRQDRWWKRGNHEYWTWSKAMKKYPSLFNKKETFSNLQFQGRTQDGLVPLVRWKDRRSTFIFTECWPWASNILGNIQYYTIQSSQEPCWVYRIVRILLRRKIRQRCCPSSPH